MPDEEGCEVGLGNADAAAEFVANQISAVDPAPHRALAHTEVFGDLARRPEGSRGAVVLFGDGSPYKSSSVSGFAGGAGSSIGDSETVGMLLSRISRAVARASRRTRVRRASGEGVLAEDESLGAARRGINGGRT